jgi:replication-associated recombination protein RarA
MVCHNRRMEESRVVDAAESPAEQAVEASVRPRTLAEYVGQQHLVGAGRVVEKAVKGGRGASRILWGPPGPG